jgi:hypothetical protein
MFKIDLLNGAELPPRSRPLRIAAATLAFLALAVAATFDAVHVYGLRGELASRQQSLVSHDRQIAGLADVAKMLETADQRRSEIDASLAEVSQIIGTHSTWSPALVALAVNLPKGTTITEVLAKREEQKNALQKGRYDHSLLMGVISPAGAAAVEQFMQALRSALPLRPGDSIRIISQRHQEIEGREVQYYVIECRLKP